MTQSIIVYRNPAEAAFWEGGYAIPLGGALIVGVVVFVLMMTLIEKILRAPRVVPWKVRKQYENSITILAAFAALVAAVVTFQYLFI